MALSIQDKISHYIPEITRDNLYAGSWGVTTVALAIFYHYAAGTFYLSLMSLPWTLVVPFCTAIRKCDPSRHNLLKNWMIVACTVTSAFLTVIAIRWIPLLAFGIKNIPHSLFAFSLVTGAIGYGGSAARALYRKGQELFKTATWEPMQALMADDAAKKRVGYWNLDFFLGLINPDLEIIRRQTSLARFLFIFLPEEQKEQQFTSLMNQYLSTASRYPREASALLPSIWVTFKSCSTELQLKLLPQLIEIAGLKILELLPPDGPLITTFQNRNKEIREKHQDFYAGCRMKTAKLYNRIDKITDDTDLSKISADLVALRDEARQHHKNIKFYCPELEVTLKDFDALQTELMSGSKIMELQRHISRKGRAEDLTHETGDYFLLGQNLPFFNALCDRLNVPQQELDNKLSELGIGTIGEFIEKVLGDKSLLQLHEEMLNRFDAFLATKNNHARIKLYGILAGKVVYKSAMVLTAIVPLIVYPRLAALGALIGMITPKFPFVARVESNFPKIYQLVCGRPLFKLVIDDDSMEMASFLSADILGKVSIIAREFFLAQILLGPPLLQDRLGVLGGVVQGMAVGREISELINNRAGIKPARL